MPFRPRTIRIAAVVRRTTLAALPLLAGLQACGGGKTPLTTPPIGAANFAGSSRDDVWAFTWELGMAHWNGEGWTTVSEGAPAPRGSIASFPTAQPMEQSRLNELILAPGRLLGVDDQGLFALDTSGAAVEEFGIPAELADADFGWTQVLTNGTAHFGTAVVNTSPPTQHMFRYEDGDWVDLQAPLEVTNFRVSSDGRVIAQTPVVGSGWGYLLYADGRWTEIEFGPDALPFFVGDTVAIASAAAFDFSDELQIKVQWLDGDMWNAADVAAGKFANHEIFLEFQSTSLEGAPAVRYARRRISGSNRFIEYGYLALHEDLTFDGRLRIVESENVCSTACLGDYEDRTTSVWTLADGSSVFSMSEKPGDDGTGNSYWLIDAP